MWRQTQTGWSGPAKSMGLVGFLHVQPENCRNSRDSPVPRTSAAAIDRRVALLAGFSFARCPRGPRRPLWSEADLPVTGDELASEPVRLVARAVAVVRAMSVASFADEPGSGKWVGRFRTCQQPGAAGSPHHHAHHDGHLGIRAVGGERFEVRGADSQLLPDRLDLSPLRAGAGLVEDAHPDIAPHAATTRWAGQRLDHHDAISCLATRRDQARRRGSAEPFA